MYVHAVNVCCDTRESPPKTSSELRPLQNLDNFSVNQNLCPVHTVLVCFRIKTSLELIMDGFDYSVGMLTSGKISQRLGRIYLAICAFNMASSRD